VLISNAASPDAADNAESTVKVLYIAGAQRSGTTILGNMLGNAAGVVQGGELSLFWAMVAHKGRCGCGALPEDCPLWGPISQRVTRRVKLSPRAMAFELQRRYLARLVPVSLLLPRYIHRFLVPRRLRLAAAIGTDPLQQLYSDIKQAARAEVIVDTSKSPAYAFLLHQRPAIELYILHLVREPRANVFSSMHDVHTRRRVPGWRGNPITRSAVWALWNMTIERLWGRRTDRYMRVLYEDFVADPAATMTRVLEFAELTTSANSVVRGHLVDMRNSHAIYGNPRQVREGTTVIREDRAWETKMRSRDRMVVQALTWLMRRRYYRSRR
jgi:hypothetical protein